MVTRAVFTYFIPRNPWQQAAGRITGSFIGRNIRLKIMSVLENAKLYAIPMLPVNIVRLPADGVVHTCSSHQIPLIGGIDECFCPEFFFIQSHYGFDPVTGLFHTFFPVQECSPVNRDIVFPDHAFKDGLRHMGLEQPHGTLRIVHGHRTLSLVPKFRLLLPPPRFRVLVIAPDPVIKFPGQSSDHFLVTHIGVAKTAGSHPAQMLVRRDNHHGFAHACHLHRRYDSRRGAAVNYYIGFNDFFPFPGLAGYQT